MPAMALADTAEESTMYDKETYNRNVGFACAYLHLLQNVLDGFSAYQKAADKYIVKLDDLIPAYEEFLTSMEEIK